MGMVGGGRDAFIGAVHRMAARLAGDHHGGVVFVAGELSATPDKATASAPDLAGVGARLSGGAIRLWIAAPVAIDPETAMPAYYAAGQRDGAEDPLYGGPVLTAAEIEDLVAYLAALR